MIAIAVESETDFEGWRRQARALVLHRIKPDDVLWSVKDSGDGLFHPFAQDTVVTTSPDFSVPREFLQLAETAILHRSPGRFALLYRLLWGLHRDPDLLQNAFDPTVAAVRTMAKEVRRDEHKMHAFVRFREIASAAGSRFVAWFEPSHHIVELAAPFFVERFADMQWSILTPDRCAHWDGHALFFGPGAIRSEAPAGDALEATWRSYYASIFNPARLKTKAMQSEMPKKYWRNLPEASLIKPLIARAEKIASVMLETAPREATRSLQRKQTPMVTKGRQSDLSRARADAADCRDCPLWKNATQTVFGEGPQSATLMLVGEQPGDKEDLAGKPFVGPAGQVLDRALKDAGIDRSKTYVTNAVKHFKFMQRGKVRLHQKPNTPEIRACRQWYERELKAIQPELVIALGATAAQSVFGKATPINRNRGRVIELGEGTKALVTVHPSYLLRLPDADAKATEYKRFVDDLKIAAAFVRRAARAA